MKKINLSEYRKGKKAQIGATLTWIVAFLIIFFIMLLFISATIVLSAQKQIPEKIGEAISFLAKGSEEQLYVLSQTESLIAILKTSVEVDIGNGIENKTIQELIFYSLEPYIEQKTGIKQYERDGLIAVGDINPSSEFNIKTKAIEKNKILFEKSQEVLNETCDGYIFVVPQGAVYKIQGHDSDYTIFGIREAETLIGKNGLKWYNPYSLVDIHYRGYLIKIKYAQLINC